MLLYEYSIILPGFLPCNQGNAHRSEHFCHKKVQRQHGSKPAKGNDLLQEGVAQRFKPLHKHAHWSEHFCHKKVQRQHGSKPAKGNDLLQEGVAQRFKPLHKQGDFWVVSVLECCFLRLSVSVLSPVVVYLCTPSPSLVITSCFGYMVGIYLALSLSLLVLAFLARCWGFVGIWALDNSKPHQRLWACARLLSMSKAGMSPDSS